jgi:hypothetical protein
MEYDDFVMISFSKIYNFLFDSLRDGITKLDHESYFLTLIVFVIGIA